MLYFLQVDPGEAPASSCTLRRSNYGTRVCRLLQRYCRRSILPLLSRSNRFQTIPLISSSLVHFYSLHYTWFTAHTGGRFIDLSFCHKKSPDATVAQYATLVHPYYTCCVCCVLLQWARRRTFLQGQARIIVVNIRLPFVAFIPFRSVYLFQRKTSPAPCIFVISLIMFTCFEPVWPMSQSIAPTL